MFSRLGFHFGARKKRKVATNTISYKRYRDILFQKVASGYLLHFVQDGSSKNALENVFLRKNVKKTHNMWEQTPIIPPSLPLEGPDLPLSRALFAAAAWAKPLNLGKGNPLPASDFREELL